MKGTFKFWSAEYASEILLGTCGVQYSDLQQTESEQPLLEDNAVYGIQNRNSSVGEPYESVKLQTEQSKVNMEADLEIQ